MRDVLFAPCVLSLSGITAAASAAASTAGGGMDQWLDRGALCILGIVILRLIVVQGKMHSQNVRARERETERLENAHMRSTDRVVAAIDRVAEQTHRVEANLENLRNAVVGGSSVPWHTRRPTVPHSPTSKSPETD